VELASKGNLGFEKLFMGVVEKRKNQTPKPSPSTISMTRGAVKKLFLMGCTLPENEMIRRPFPRSLS
jgi:hypothetical protein